MLSIRNGLKKLALAGVATAGLIATTTAASADWNDWHHHHRYHGSSVSISIGAPYYRSGYRDYGNRYYDNRGYGYGSSDWRAFCNSDSPHYDRGRCLSFRESHPGIVSPLAFCNSGSPDYDARRCWEFKH